MLVIEITSEVPTGHNVGQRFARLVRAIELGIPTIYYFPFDAKKHGQYSSVCNLNIRLLAAAKKMYEIHNTPLLCVNWPTDKHGELITDGTENEVMISLLKSYVDSDFNPACSEFIKHLVYMDNEYNKRLTSRPSYKKMPPSVTKSKTEALIEQYQLYNVPSTFLNREGVVGYLRIDLLEKRTYLPILDHDELQQTLVFALSGEHHSQQR